MLQSLTDDTDYADDTDYEQFHRVWQSRIGFVIGSEGTRSAGAAMALGMGTQVERTSTPFSNRAGCPSEALPACQKGTEWRIRVAVHCGPLDVSMRTNIRLSAMTSVHRIRLICAAVSIGRFSHMKPKTIPERPSSSRTTT